MKVAQIQQKFRGMPASDGAGVKLFRSVGARPGLRVDPFLMLDEFSSDDAADYIAGFPSHPHRGFQTLTYMLHGHMLHEDHLGNRGHLRAGDVQWMHAGRGIIHSEMPQQESGRMQGFQLWLNVPAAEKMTAPWYRDIPAASIPLCEMADGVRAKLIAGVWDSDDGLLVGPVKSAASELQFLDIELAVGSVFERPLTDQHNAFLYVYDGELDVAGQTVGARELAVLEGADVLRLAAPTAVAKCLFLSAKPLAEPVVQYGPFVMNTRDEIEQALQDYASGRLVST